MAKSTTSPRNSPSVPKKKNRTRWLAFAVLPILVCGGWWAGTTIYHKLTFQPTGQIAFACIYESKVHQICVINADGSGQKQLTYEKNEADSPVWSPDASRIAFEVLTHNLTIDRYVTVLFIMNSDGSNIKQLTDRGADPAWSPDGMRLAFSRINTLPEEDIAGIYTIGKDGSDEIRLNNLSAYKPTWSPDGARIAFTVYPNKTSSNPRIFVMNADGSNQTVLINSLSRSPAWSLDGKRIAYNCGDELCVINSDGTGLTQLTRSFPNLLPSSPTWSPDGQYIAYTRQNPLCLLCTYSGEIWLMKADGSQQTKLTRGPIDLDPVWAPQQ